MNLPPRLSDEEIDLRVDESLQSVFDVDYPSNVVRPMFQLLSIDPGYEDNPKDYWSPDVAHWFADGRIGPYESVFHDEVDFELEDVVQ